MGTTETSTTETTAEASADNFRDSLAFVKKAVAQLADQAVLPGDGELPRLADQPDYTAQVRDLLLTKPAHPDCRKKWSAALSVISTGRIEHSYQRCGGASCEHCVLNWISATMRRAFEEVGDGTIYRFRLSTRTYRQTASKQRKRVIRDEGGSWVAVNVCHDDVEFFATHNLDGKGEPVEAAPAILDAILRSPRGGEDGKRPKRITFPKATARHTTDAELSGSGNVITFPGAGPAADEAEPDRLFRRLPRDTTIEEANAHAARAWGGDPLWDWKVNRRGGPFSQRAACNVTSDQVRIHRLAFAPLYQEAQDELVSMQEMSRADYMNRALFKQTYPQQAQAG